MADRRLQLLELREREVPEFRNMKMIPPNAIEINADIFKVRFHRHEYESCLFLNLYKESLFRTAKSLPNRLDLMYPISRKYASAEKFTVFATLGS